MYEMLKHLVPKSAHCDQESCYIPGLRAGCAKEDACVQEFLILKGWILGFNLESLIKCLPGEDILWENLVELMYFRKQEKCFVLASTFLVSEANLQLPQGMQFLQM